MPSILDLGVIEDELPGDPRAALRSSRKMPLWPASVAHLEPTKLTGFVDFARALVACLLLRRRRGHLDRRHFFHKKFFPTHKISFRHFRMNGGGERGVTSRNRSHLVQCDQFRLGAIVRSFQRREQFRMDRTP